MVSEYCWYSWVRLETHLRVVDDCRGLREVGKGWVGKGVRNEGCWVEVVGQVLAR